jgi:diaminohydroxyphosphoribosylaminopyrimidine deaminase/5-amino-6-(5-phosphoribosylamino)uracil reductase
MRRALQLAISEWPHPNPRVGSVVVAAHGAVIGEGAHASPGEDHAEIVALKRAGEAAAGSTLYTTLEPCVHQGRTPPCVEEIIRTQVRRVVVGTGDPDAQVSGQGVRALRDAGIEVLEGVLEGAARMADPGYFHHRETGLPRVTLKYAMTLDGSAAASDRTSQWITSPETRQDAHRLRSGSDAVVVGAGTLRRDDPRLDVRLAGYEGPQPRPVIVAGGEDLPRDARLWERNPLVIAASERALPGGELAMVASSDGYPDPRAVCELLADRGYLDVLLEGGPTLAGAWLESGMVAAGVVYVGAKLGGGKGIPPLGGVFETIDEAIPVSVVAVQGLGDDLRIDFERK